MTKPLQYVETQHDQPLGKIKSRNPIKSLQAQPVTQQRWICWKKPTNLRNPLKKRAKAKHTNITIAQQKWIWGQKPTIRRTKARRHSTVKFNILQNHKANNMNSTPFYTASGS